MLIVILAVTLRISSSKQSKGELDFSKAALLSSQLNGNPETVEQLRALIKRHPELKSKYQGMLAHSELKTDPDPTVVELAEGLINSNTLYEEHPDLLPLKEFSTISLAITDGQLDQALERSLRLQRTLEEEDRLDYLLTLNTLRIASLYRQTQNETEEEAWLSQLQQQLIKQPQQISVHFQAGSLSLRDYIQQRKEQLQKIL